MNDDQIAEDDDVVPIDFDPREEQLSAEPPEGDDLTDLDMMIDLLQIYDVGYTLVSDESGTTIELPEGARGVFGFSGVSITINFGPVAAHEKFLFFGLAK